VNENDPGEAFAQRADEREDEQRLQPPDDGQPDVFIPDFLAFRETKESTDRALSERFYREHQHLFVNGDGALHVYRGRADGWTSDCLPSVLHAMCQKLSDHYGEEQVQVIQQIAELRAAQADGVDRLVERREAIGKMIVYTEKASTIGNVARLATAKLEAVKSRKQVMNPNPELLACSNGAVDLRTGTIRRPRLEDYITRNTGTAYDTQVDDGWWREIVQQIAGGNARIAEFIQVWFGYCATGYTREHSMAILWGLGRNGKNLVVDSVAAALGGYAAMLPAGSLESNGDRAPDNNMFYSLADLHGIRFGYTSETGEKGKLKEAWIKSQTGDRIIKGRVPYGAFFEFNVTHKITLSTNHMPEVSGTDDGIWSRIRVVPFTTRFGTQAELDAGIAQRIKDEGLLSRTSGEAGRRAVLKWLVEGAGKYLARGLDHYVPPEIATQTNAYRREQDVLGQFLQDVCEWVYPEEVQRVKMLEAASSGSSREFREMSLDDRLRVEVQQLWQVYHEWAVDRGYQSPLTSIAFSRRITTTPRYWTGDTGEELLMAPLEKVKANTAYFYKYIRLNETGKMLRNKAQARNGARQQDRREEDF
jgi:P4 family phage/plasmid primase-like protien